VVFYFLLLLCCPKLHGLNEFDLGKKCKFSHNLDIERKVEKRSLYTDTREEEKEEKEKDNMADWDEEKLRQVVMSKHGNPKTTTDKVCKFFVSAVEDGKYGWFWTCPNGGDKCMYRHSLPPGYVYSLHCCGMCLRKAFTNEYSRFVLKTKEQRAAEKALMDKSPLATLTLEDFLESERTKLFGTLTPVTPETFAKWKKERMDKKAAEEEAKKMKEATGRAMFEKGDWNRDSDDEDSDDGEDLGTWNLEALRKETENARLRKEEERLAQLGGSGVVPPPPYENGNGKGKEPMEEVIAEGSGTSSSS
jgi:hypothetical protein